MTTLLPFALSLLLQSTALLLLGLLALHITRQRGPAVQSLVGRATLSGVVLLLLLAPLTGHVQTLWRVTLEPTAARPSAAKSTPPRSSASLPKREGKELRTSPGPSFRGEKDKTASQQGTTIGKGAESNQGAARSEGAASSAPTPVMPPLRPPLWGGPLRSKEVGSYLYATVTLTLLLWLAVCQWHLTRLRRTATRLTSGPAAEMLAELTAQPPQVLTHPAVRSPFLAGLVRPAIFLPKTYDDDFSPDALRAILTHELAHLQRRDNAWTLASRLLCALLWPQPLLWLICRKLEQSAEDACDAAVLAQNCPPRAYADCLLSLAERHPLMGRQQMLGAGVAPYRSSLGRRVQHILTQGKQTMLPISTKLRVTIAALTLAAVLGGVCLVSSAPAKPTEVNTPVLTPQEKQYRMAYKKDLQNLKQIGLAIVIYERDHDYRTPNANHWMDQITPYLKDPSVLFDPFQPSAKRYGYAFNRLCSKKSLAVFDYPAETVIVYDSTLRTRNANDTGQSPSLRTIKRSSDNSFISGSSYGFVDGHAKWFTQGIHPSFSLKGGEPTGTTSLSPAQIGKSAIVGTWLCSQADGTGNVLIFSENGNIEEVGPWPGEGREVGHSYSSNSVVGHSYGHYIIAGSKLKYTFTRVWVEGEKPYSSGSENHAMDYTLSGDTLTLHWDGNRVAVSHRIPSYTKAMLGLKPNTNPETQLYEKTNQQLSKAQFLAGLTPVQGPGVIVTLRDSKLPYPKNLPPSTSPPNIIHDSDINQVVNELRSAGAEAISVNDQRLVATSAVRCVGPLVYVNNVPQAPPYTIKAIGNATAMLSLLKTPRGLVSLVQRFDPAMISVRASNLLELPAFTSGSSLRYAKPISPQTSLQHRQKALQAQLMANQMKAKQAAMQLQEANAQLSTLKFPLQATPNAETDQNKLLDQQIDMVLAKIAHLTITDNKVLNHPEVVAAKAQLHALEAARILVPMKEKQKYLETVRKYAQQHINAWENVVVSKSRMAEANRRIMQEQAALEALTKRMQNAN